MGSAEPLVPQEISNLMAEITMWCKLIRGYHPRTALNPARDFGAHGDSFPAVSAVFKGLSIYPLGHRGTTNGSYRAVQFSLGFTVPQVIKNHK